MNNSLDYNVCLCNGFWVTLVTVVGGECSCAAEAEHGIKLMYMF